MKIKKIITILIIVLLIILIVLISLLLGHNNQEEITTNSDAPTAIESGEIDSTLKKVEARNDFYAVERSVQKYYQYLTMNTINSNNITAGPEENNVGTQSIIYDMLDKQYIQYKNLTEDNLFDIIEPISTSEIIIDNMYVSQIDENMSVYIVLGKEINQSNKEEKSFNMLVKMDMANRTFSLILDDMAEEIIKSSKVGETLDIEVESSIEKKDYNTFTYEDISDEEYITDMFNDFKTYMMYYQEEAYEQLDEEYREKKFGTYEEFQQFINNNIRDIVIMKADKFKVEDYDEYVQYIVSDQNENFYIFNENGTMDYTVILDTYTVDIPEFTEEYNNAQDSEKVLLNLQKVFNAINDGDYKYVYNKLDNTFKQTNFPTEEDFENYIKNNFYEENSIGYSNYKTSGDLHIYEIEIKDSNNASNVEKTKNFIMQLKDGTDFVMSFEV